MTSLANIKSLVVSLAQVYDSKKRGYARAIIPSGSKLTLVGTSPELSFYATPTECHVYLDGVEIGTAEWYAEAWDLFEQYDAVIISRKACITTGGIKFPANGIVYKFEVYNEETVAIDEIPDGVEAIYIETDNTALNALQSLLRDRPIVLDTMGGDNKLRMILEWKDRPDVIVRATDMRAISIPEANKVPSRAVVFSGDVLPVDPGGDVFGTAVVRVVADTLFEEYGAKRLVLQLGQRIVLTANKLTGARIGDIIRLDYGGNIQKAVVVEKEINVNPPGSLHERIGGVLVD